MFINENTLMFDKENCENCYQEMLAWDAEIHEEQVKKLYGKNYKSVDEMIYTYSKSQEAWIAHPNQKLCKNPRKDKHRQWRRCDRYRRAKEHYDERRPWQKKFRNKMKRQIDREEYYRPVNHDYLTYGYLSW